MIRVYRICEQFYEQEIRGYQRSLNQFPTGLKSVIGLPLFAELELLKKNISIYSSSSLIVVDMLITLGVYLG